MHRLFAMPFAMVYRAYVAKVERKGRTRAELDEAIRWFTGYDADALAAHVEAGTTVADFFGRAALNPRSTLVTGVVCGVRVEAVEDPQMRTVRILDKLVDELAKGRPMAKVLRA